MATLTVEGIPAGLLARLADAAAANGRCLNSEVILSLVRHVQAEPRRRAASRPGVIACPLEPWLRPERSRVLNVAWGDPG